jgi:hypothetical protein
MRVVRTIGAVSAWLLATVLLVLAVVLSVTIVLLPVGVLLGIASFRLYKLGLKWALPRTADVKKGVRKEAHRWRRQLRPRRTRRSKPLRRRARRVRRALRRR